MTAVWLRVLERYALAVSVALVALFAVIDRVTGVEITFVVLTYLLPIAIATWFCSRRAGLIIALASTAGTALSPYNAIGNAIGAFAMFAVFAWILAALRGHVERERLQRHATVDQLRHAERLNVIGTLAAGAAHEIGTPLNVISGAAEMFVGRRAHARERGEALDVDPAADRQDHRARSRHLLDFGRRGGTAPTSIALDAAVRDAVRSAVGDRSQARGHGPCPRATARARCAPTRWSSSRSSRT